MKTLAEFVRSKVPMTLKQYSEVYGDETPESDKLFIYADGYYIEVFGKDEFLMVIMNESHLSKKLSEMERILWDSFVKWELGLTTREAEADLDKRAKELLDDIGFSCSLCEVCIDEDSTLSQRVKDDIMYLLNQFDLVDETKDEKEFEKKYLNKSYKYDVEKHKICREVELWGSTGKFHNEPIVFRKIKNLSDSHLLHIISWIEMRSEQYDSKTLEIMKTEQIF